MIADVARFIACDYTADRVPLPGGLVLPVSWNPTSAPYSRTDDIRFDAIRFPNVIGWFGAMGMNFGP